VTAGGSRNCGVSKGEREGNVRGEKDRRQSDAHGMWDWKMKCKARTNPARPLYTN